MKRINILLLILFTCSSLSAWAQVQQQHSPRDLQQYWVYDLGTLGGPNSSTSFFAPSLSIRGAIGGAQTPVHDPFDPNCVGDVFFPGCYVMHAFQWNDGVMTDLGALGKKEKDNGSFASAVNNFGWVAGYSENGAADPNTGYPVAHAVVWKQGKIIDLGTFGGTQSSAMAVNDFGQAIGGALNNIDDPWSAQLVTGFGGVSFPGTTQMRAFVWQNGRKRDLGTLGGPDAFAYAINRFGQIAGESYTGYTPNDTTGIPTVDPFLWSNGKMIDLGSLGGTIGWSVWLNDWGQVIGISNLAGDQSFHGFLWSFGKLIDLPPASGGDTSYALWINNLGNVVGTSLVTGDTATHASLWSWGTSADLGTIGQDDCSEAWGINDLQQIVGVSYPCSNFGGGHAFLWQNGGPALDLNALVENPSDLHLYLASYVSNWGGIVAQGTFPNGDIHTALLVPSGPCEGTCKERIAQKQNEAVAPTHAVTAAGMSKRDWLRKHSATNRAVPDKR